MLLSILVLLFAQAVKEKPPLPTWIDQPLPHWSCPAGWVVHSVGNDDEPRCRKGNRSDRELGNYDPQKQEAITWTWLKAVPEGGVLRIDYPDGFVKIPGCAISDEDDKTQVVLVDEVSKWGITVFAKPGSRIRLNCGGVLARPPRIVWHDVTGSRSTQ